MADPWGVFNDFFQKGGVPNDPMSKAVDMALMFRGAFDSMTKKASPPPLVIMESMNGLVLNKFLGIGCELEIPDLLKREALTALELSQLLGTQEDKMERFLSFLVIFGVLNRSGDGKYFNTPV